MSLLKGFFGLSNDVNKATETDSEQGVVSDLLPELVLDMKDEELSDLSKSWLKKWEPYAAEIAKKQDDNENYWLGKQFTEGSSEGHALVDNLIFESFETFLPIATRPKAEPLVESIDSSQPNDDEAKRIRDRITKLVDDLSYNLKLKQTARYWGLYLLGAMKVGFSMKENDITAYTLRPQKLILDSDATINECEYTGEYVGEYRTDTASNLIARFPKSKEFITSEVRGKLGTTIKYVEWWHDEYFFVTLKDEVLTKSKNPHYNYDTKDTQTSVDEFGMEMPQEVDVPGVNHFNRPKKPYIFLSIFNLGKHPMDDTNLIQQNLPLQDLVNKRFRQIDKNADNANGGIVVSGDYFTKEQASQAQSALRKGAAIWQPTGSVNDGIKRDTGAPLPPFVYENLQDVRNELRNIFGTRGSTPQGTINEPTVRGKITVKGQDADRIGGGISTYLEQFSDKVFNYLVQLMYVYDEQAPQGKYNIGVKEGSMIPKDPMTQRNESIDLWAQKALDPITFFKKLEFPDPQETAKQLFLWMSDPIQLFPELLAKQQEQQMVQQIAEQEGQAAQMEHQQVGQQKDADTRQQEKMMDHGNKMEQIQANNLGKLPPQ